MSKNIHQIKREDLGEAKMSLAVEVNKSSVQSATKSVQKQILKHVKIPGFRRDKTPLALVKRYVGADRFNEYVQRELLPKAYYEALEQEDLSPISQVEYDGIEFGKDSFHFKASFSVAPEFKLGDYSKLKVEAPAEVEVDDKEIDEFLSELSGKHADMQDVEEGTETAKGHHVSLLVKGKLDGKDSKHLRHYNVGVTLGEDELYPGFDKELLGKKKLDRHKFTYKFDKDHENKALAGQEAEFEVKILGHKTVETPKVDDDFAKKVGPFEGLEQLKDTVKMELGNKKKEEVMGDFRKAIQDELYKLVKCELPEALRDELTNAKLDDVKHEVAHHKKQSWEEYLESEGKSEEELIAEMNTDSDRELKLSFALTEIAKKENLEVADLEIIQRIDYTARVLRKNFDEVLEYVESLGRRVLIRSEIMQEKALGFLENKLNPVEEVKVEEEKAQEA